MSAEAKYDDDVSSMCSSFSMVSLANGEEVSADQALDESLREIQQATNNVHGMVRCMLTSDERGEDYIILKEQFDEVDSCVKDAVLLWKDLKMIAKQLVPPRPRASKKKAAEPSVLESCHGGGV